MKTLLDRNGFVLTLVFMVSVVFTGAACAFERDDPLANGYILTPTPEEQTNDQAENGVGLEGQRGNQADEGSFDTETSPEMPEIEENPGNQSNSRVTIINDDETLKRRIKSVNEPIEIQASESDISSFLPSNRGLPDTNIILGGLINTARSNDFTDQIVRLFRLNEEDTIDENSAPDMRSVQKGEMLSLTLIAEVAPPELDGQTLQATSVDIQGNNAYISYNVRGNPFLGGIDVIDIRDEDNPEIKSQALFKDSDVHSLTFSNGNVYAAQATNDPEFEDAAALEVIDTKGGRLVLDNNERVPLKSYASTSVAVSGNKVFVTTGNTGGLFVYERKSLELEKFIELDDARWVSVDKKKVAVMQGTSGRITVFNEKDLNKLSGFRIDGADIPESKSTVQVISDIALVAAGMGGMQIVGLENGEVLAEIPMPIVRGLNPDVTVTNAVTADGDLIFISNGEAGVYAARSERKLNQYKGDTSIPLAMVGKLQFDTQESVNHVLYKGKYLFIASGLGGLKIVKVEEIKESKNNRGDDSDDDEDENEGDDDSNDKGKKDKNDD